MPQMMKSVVFANPGLIVLDDQPAPEAGPHDALTRISTTVAAEDPYSPDTDGRAP